MITINRFMPNLCLVIIFLTFLPNLSFAQDSDQSIKENTEQKIERQNEQKSEEKSEQKSTKKSNRRVKNLYAEFETSMGNFKARLFFARAPRTVENFIGLSEGTKKWIDPKTKAEVLGRPFYNGLLFFAVRKNLLVQTGDPINIGSNLGSGFPIQDEFHPDLTHWKAGMLSMANRGKDTAESQFFISLKDQKYLDGKNVVFGEVVEGLPVLEAMSRVPVDQKDKPKIDIVLKSIKIIREY